jgi:transglycosylase-like protein
VTNIVVLITTAVMALGAKPPLPAPEPVASSSTPGGATREAGRALPVSPSALPGSPVLACIRRWESATKGLYRAVSPGGFYRGAYQFDFGTWLGVGGSGDPALATPAEQDYRAALLVGLRGLAPWPTPARRCA